MKVRELPDIAAFWLAAERYLSRDPANNTHQLGAAKRIKEVGALHGERFFVVYAHDAETAPSEPLASAIIVESKLLFLAVMSPEAAAVIARHLRANSVRISGVIGMKSLLQAFTDGYGLPFTTHVNLMLYQLMRAPNHGRANGSMRVATLHDLDLLTTWHRAFEIEAGMLAVPTPITVRITRRLNQQQLLVWTENGEAVAMAGAHPLPAASARIGPVYTPPELRGHGYAQAVVAAACAHLAKDGPRTVFLFTDAEYPASNICYQRIGFVHQSDHAHLLFTHDVGA